VTGIHYRHPAILANMATTLDIVSGGRLELGLGAGWNEEESGAYGIELGTPGERSDRFEEACEVIVGLLTQETTNFEGRYYQFTNARNEPKPVQRPHPPICVGGSGEKRTLRTAARFAQHWNFVGGTPEEFARKRDVLHQHCEDLGRDPSEILLSSHVIFAGRRAGLRRPGRRTGRGRCGVGHRHDPATLRSRSTRAAGHRVELPLRSRRFHFGEVVRCMRPN
jgi:alkanesulfonate monooxygenase SsuD/methylene tetrahydromethanopterin reductase-like flavin-dependent oxidoreductase (luciferase family)